MKLKLERICEWLGASTMPGQARPSPSAVYEHQKKRGNINKVWSNNMMLCVSSCKKELEIDNSIPRQTFCGNKLQSMVVRVTIRTPQTQVSSHNIYKEAKIQSSERERELKECFRQSWDKELKDRRLRYIDKFELNKKQTNIKISWAPVGAKI